MKKMLVLVVIVTIVITLVACKPTPAAPTPTPTPTPTEKISKASELFWGAGDHAQECYKLAGEVADYAAKHKCSQLLDDSAKVFSICDKLFSVAKEASLNIQKCTNLNDAVITEIKQSLNEALDKIPPVEAPLTAPLGEYLNAWSKIVEGITLLSE